ncbi:hypothetical protein [Arthrobacter sp. NPDC090010]|uniref:hypothetical protein n=1 Tax=Arthrobacter sp. NPDC090010 TaxID=3363942 RepID=UPI003828333E
MRGSGSAFLAGIILLFAGSIGAAVVAVLAATGRLGQDLSHAVALSTTLYVVAGAISFLGSMMILVGIYRGLKSIDDLHKDRFGGF